MANEQYIRNTRGDLVTTIPAGKNDTGTTSLVLHGYGVSEYGQLRDQNLVYLLETFYSTTPPTNPVDGQLWYDPLNQLYILTLTGSPASGIWDEVVPPSDTLGFNVIAGAGLTGGGFPTTSPSEVVLNVGAGTGIRVGSPVGFITVKESEINHNTLSGYVANEHLDHSLITISAGAGLFMGSPNDYPTPIVGEDVRDLTASFQINVGPGDGIQVNADSVQVDSTVVLLGGSPEQTIGGNKQFYDQLRGFDGSGVAYTFTNDIDTGVQRVAPNTLGFVTGGITRFTLESDGVLAARAGSPQYEIRVIDDDDIPNKASVDSLGGTGVSPTENTFVGTSSISGLTADKKYLVNVYGLIPSKGNTNFTLDGIALRTGTSLGLGTLIADTGAFTINWCDGQAPTSCSFIFDSLVYSSATSINCQINDNSTGGGDVYSSYMTAVQLN